VDTLLKLFALVDCAAVTSSACRRKKGNWKITSHRLKSSLLNSVPNWNKRQSHAETCKRH